MASRRLGSPGATRPRRAPWHSTSTRQTCSTVPPYALCLAFPALKADGRYSKLEEIKA